MDRPHRHRRLVVASLSIGAAAAFGVPTLVSAGATERATSIEGSAPDDAAPTIGPDAAPRRTTATGSAGSTEEASVAVDAPTPTTAVETATTLDAEPAPAAPAPMPTAPAPMPAAPEPAPPAPAAEEAPVVEEAATTGRLTVDVAATADATRQVSLRTATGELVAGPVTVDGNPITFSDLTPGDHDLFVEHFADGGGTFLTRTPITIAAGSDLLATCDAETLDCTLS